MYETLTKKALPYLTLLVHANVGGIRGFPGIAMQASPLVDGLSWPTPRRKVIYMTKLWNANFMHETFISMHETFISMQETFISMCKTFISRNESLMQENENPIHHVLYSPTTHEHFWGKYNMPGEKVSFS